VAVFTRSGGVDGCVGSSADEEMAALKQLGDLQAVVDARERLIAQRATLLAPSDRKMEIVRL
jgi:hypothetical protein